MEWLALYNDFRTIDWVNGRTLSVRNAQNDMHDSLSDFFSPDVDEVRNLERELFELLCELGTESDYFRATVFKLQEKLTWLVKKHRQIEWS